jgi:hypothetical protein
MADPLSSIARRAEQRPHFLAALLGAYARSEDLDDAELAGRLGCAVEQLSRLKLCRAPRSEPAEMRQDVARLAGLFGVDEVQLCRAVLRGRVVLRLRQGSDSVLLAARDRESEP